MPNDSKQLSYLKRNAARSKDIFLLAPNHILPATHDLIEMISQTLSTVTSTWYVRVLLNAEMCKCTHSPRVASVILLNRCNVTYCKP